MRALSPRDIVERLSDRFALLTSGSRTALTRQQTLRATLDWSYGLLREPERLLLARLAVFAGGFDLPAAEAVCADERLPAAGVLDSLARLVDRSLVVPGWQAGRRRYRLLETVREYARLQLQQRGEEAAMRRRHAEWAVALAEEADPHLRGADRAPWQARLEQEHDNLRAALGWLAEADDPAMLELGLRLAGRLYWFWHLAGHSNEARARLDTLLARAPGEPSVGLVLALTGAGRLGVTYGEYEIGIPRLERAVELAAQLGDDRLRVAPLVWSGWGLLFQGRRAAARARYQEALALYRAQGDAWGVALATLDLGFAATEADEREAAHDAYAAALDGFRACGDSWGIASALIQLAQLTYRMGQLDDARQQAEEVEAIVREMGDGWLLMQVYGLRAEIARAQGDLAAAEQSAREGLDVARRARHQALIGWLLRDLGAALLGRGAVEEARAAYDEGLHTFLRHRYPLGAACCLVGLAAAAERDGDLQACARLLGTADAVLDELGLALAPADGQLRERAAAAVAEAAAPTIAEAYTAGRAAALGLLSLSPGHLAAQDA